MRLEEFISETLKQIIDGVITSQEYAKEKGAMIIPEGLINYSQSTTNYSDEYRRNPAQIIEFDVALTTIEKNETSGKAGIFVSVFKMGVEGKDGSENSTISRIKFSLPMNLPIQTKIK